MNSASLMSRLESISQYYQEDDQKFLDALRDEAWTVRAIGQLAGSQKTKALADRLYWKLSGPQLKPAEIRQCFDDFYDSWQTNENKISPAVRLAGIQGFVTLISSIAALFIGSSGIMNYLRNGGTQGGVSATPRVLCQETGSTAPDVIHNALDSHLIHATIVFLLIALWFTPLVKPRVGIEPAGPIARRSFRQFLSGWLAVCCSWGVLYCWLSLSFFFRSFAFQPFDSDAYVWSVADAFNGITSFGFFYCFLVLDLPSVASGRNPARDDSFRKSVGIIAGITVLVVVLAIVDRLGGAGFSIELFGRHVAPPSLGGVGGFLAAAFAGMSVAFLAGRFDSYWLELPRWMLVPIYLYSLIQVAWVSFGASNSNSNSNPIAEPALFGLAMLLKIFLFLVVAYLVRERKLAQYLDAAERGQLGTRAESVIRKLGEPQEALKYMASRLDRSGDVVRQFSLSPPLPTLEPETSEFEKSMNNALKRGIVVRYLANIADERRKTRIEKLQTMKGLSKNFKPKPVIIDGEVGYVVNFMIFDDSELVISVHDGNEASFVATTNPLLIGFFQQYFDASFQSLPTHVRAENIGSTNEILISPLPGIHGVTGTNK